MTTVVYECYRKSKTAIKHVWHDLDNITRCGLKPTKKQWTTGEFSFEHECSKEINCSECWSGL